MPQKFKPVPITPDEEPTHAQTAAALLHFMKRGGLLDASQVLYFLAKAGLIELQPVTDAVNSFLPVYKVTVKPTDQPAEQSHHAACA